MKKFAHITAVSVTVLLVSLVGFFITIDVAPHLAYARLFIDIGLGISLVAILMMFEKSISLDIAKMISWINDIKNNEFSSEPKPSLFSRIDELFTQVHKLSKSLKEAQAKEKEAKKNLREELLPKLKENQLTQVQHSFHPELGPVEPIKALEPEENHEEVAKSFDFKSELLTNSFSLSSSPSVEDSQVDEKLELPEKQDLGELFHKLVHAQEELEQEPTEYRAFVDLIEKTKKDIQKTHGEGEIFFEVITKNDSVALQPRISRP